MQARNTYRAHNEDSSLHVILNCLVIYGCALANERICFTDCFVSLNLSLQNDLAINNHDTNQRNLCF